MGIHVFWNNKERNVMIWEITGQWNWMMLSAAAEDATELRRKLPYRQSVTTILNLVRAAPLQTGELMLDTAPALEIVATENGDSVIFVGREAFNLKMRSIFRRMNIDLGANVHSVGSMIEAEHILREQQAPS